MAAIQDEQEKERKSTVPDVYPTKGTRPTRELDPLTRGLISGMTELATPAGGMTGTTPAYRLGESTRAAAWNLTKPLRGGGNELMKSVNYVGGMAKDFYQGMRGIPEGTEVATGDMSAIRDAGTGEMTQQKATPAPGTVGAPGKAGAPGKPATTQRPLLTNPWAGATMGSTPMKAMGNGLFASGQGQEEGESMYQWSKRDGNNIRTVMLPAGVRPESLTEQQLAAYNPQTESLMDDARDVKVIRGLREFKGGREVRDGMTDERKTRQSINSVISSLVDAQNQGVEQGTAGGVISQILSGNASRDVAATQAAATVSAAAQKAASEAGKKNVDKVADFELPTGKVNILTGLSETLKLPIIRIGNQMFMVNPEHPSVMTPMFMDQDKPQFGSPMNFTDEQLSEIAKRMEGAEKESKSIWQRFFGD